MRSSPFFWLLTGLLGLTVLLLVLRHDAGTIAGLSNGRFAQLAFLVALLIFLLTGVLGRGTFGRTVRYATIWGLIVLVAIVGYTYRDELGVVLQRVTAEIFPGEAAVQTSDSGDSVIVTRSRRSTHFSVVTTINNAKIDMLVDTGASVITLRVEDARLIGINTQGLQYSVPVMTANGMARAAPVVLNYVAIGPIEERRVSALVAQEGMLEKSLLGLNFLNELSSFTIAGNQLILTP